MAAECVSPAIASLGKPAGIEKLVLAAPDIDAGIFENDFLSQIIANCNETTLYGSSNDFALRASKHVNGFLRLGDSAPEISVFKEIDSIDASTIQSDFFRHGYFSTSDRLLTDIYSFLFQNLKPEQRRLKPEPSSNGLRYWRFA
jgi:esterase/lipase superfamily enzyme